MTGAQRREKAATEVRADLVVAISMSQDVLEEIGPTAVTAIATMLQLERHRIEVREASQ